MKAWLIISIILLSLNTRASDNDCLSTFDRIMILKDKKRMSWDKEIIAASFAHLYSSHSNPTELTRDILIKSSNPEANELLTTFLHREIKTQALVKAALRTTQSNSWDEVLKSFPINTPQPNKVKIDWSKEKIKEVLLYILKHHSEPEKVTLSTLKRNIDEEANTLLEQVLGVKYKTAVIERAVRANFGKVDWHALKKELNLPDYKSGVIRWNSKSLDEIFTYILKNHSNPESITQNALQSDSNEEVSKLIKDFLGREYKSSSLMSATLRKFQKLNFQIYLEELSTKLVKNITESKKRQFVIKIDREKLMSLSNNPSERDEYLKDEAKRYFGRVVYYERIRKWIKQYDFELYAKSYDVPSYLSNKSRLFIALKESGLPNKNSDNNLKAAYEIMNSIYEKGMKKHLFEKYLHEIFGRDVKYFFTPRLTKKQKKEIVNKVKAKGLPKKDNILGNSVELKKIYLEVTGKELNDTNYKYTVRLLIKEDKYLFARGRLQIEMIGELVIEHYNKTIHMNTYIDTIENNLEAFKQALKHVISEDYSPSDLHLATWITTLKLNKEDFAISNANYNSAEKFYQMNMSKGKIDNDSNYESFFGDNSGDDFIIADTSYDLTEEVSLENKLKTAKDLISHFSINDPIKEFIIMAIVDINIKDTETITKALLEKYSADEIENSFSEIMNDSELSEVLVRFL